YRAAITLIDPEQGTLRVYALSSKWTTDFFRIGREINRNDSHSGWVLDHQRALIRRDLEKECEFLVEQRLLDEGMQSYCAVPLPRGGRIIGTLNVGSDAKNQYSEADAEFLCEVANQVALAVGNMKAYEEIAALNTQVKRSAERNRTLLEINNAVVSHLTPEALLRSVSKILRHVVPFEGAAITIYNAKKQTFRYYAIERATTSSHF